MMFPSTHITLPSLPTPEETVNEAARELGRALQKMATNNPAYAHLGTYSGLKQLTDIVHSTTNRAKAQRVEQEQLQRVSTEQPSPERAQPNANAIPFDEDKVAPPQRVPIEVEPCPAPRPARQLHDPLYNKPILPSTQRYPTRRKALNKLLEQNHIQPPPSTPPPPANLMPSNIPPSFINAILDDSVGEVDIDVILHGVQQGEARQLNAVIDPKT
ncbi:hypothetical protein ACHAWF_000887, partial [Thalassiosira exigua]